MAELIGATLAASRNFRHLLLTFDRIAWSNADEKMRIAAAKDKPLLADWQFLIDRGVLYSPEIPPTWSNSGLDELAAIARGLPPLLAEDSPQTIRHRVINTATRIYALRVKDAERANAVPILMEWSDHSERPTTRADVVHLVLGQLPIPGATHSLKDILAFRDEARSEGLIQGLRVWINEMASGKLTALEVSDKLEDLVSRYERTLKLEKMTRDTGIVETFVTTTAEIAESLVKFQWSAVAKKLFEVRHQQIDLMKAEMAAPGREVAYLVKARERFGS